MQLTVQEIIKMIDENKLHYDQTTQRGFIYYTISKKTDDGEITKAGNVIKSILEYDIQLPALFFWEKENGEYNVHDGKQRILSIYYFIRPVRGINIVTRLRGREINFIDLLPEEQKKLLEYKFDVVVKKGTPEHEEHSFYLINTNSEPLTDYESLRGMFHGTWLYEFERYMEAKSSVIDAIKKIGRGEQAILFLYNCFGLLGERDATTKVRAFLREIRNNEFSQQHYKLDEIIEVFAEIVRITSINHERSVQVASFIINRGWDRAKILSYYYEIINADNDVKSWKFDTHKVAIEKLIQENIKCDGKRLYTDADKSILYKRSQKCSALNCNATSYKELQVDHDIPWSQGGRTILDNAQLLCKAHNASKGADTDGIKG